MDASLGWSVVIDGGWQTCAVVRVTITSSHSIAQPFHRHFVAVEEAMRTL
jgi:hypothetical protein